MAAVAAVARNMCHWGLLCVLCMESCCLIFLFLQRVPAATTAYPRALLFNLMFCSLRVPAAALEGRPAAGQRAAGGAVLCSLRRLTDCDSWASRAPIAGDSHACRKM